MSGPRQGYDPTAFARMAELEPRSWWFRSRNRLIEDTVRSFFPNARSVLEIGCGTGFTLGALGRALPAATLTGTELFEEGLDVARRRWPDIALTQADARALPFDTRFDLVGAFDVIEHIDDAGAALREAFRVLWPGGGLVLTVPQHRWLWSPADDHAHHQRRYSRRGLVEAVRGAGFTVMRVTSFVSLLLPLMAASRVRRRRTDEFDPWAEFRIPRAADRAFELLATAERALIDRGISLPAGGSLLLAASKPYAAR